MRSSLLLACWAAALLSCGGSESMDHQFEAAAREYIEEALAMYPEYATRLGDHRYDNQISDYSKEGIQKSLGLDKRYLARLGEIDTSRLTGANEIDYQLLKHNIEGSIFRTETLREYEWNPLFYNPGGAIYGLIARDFAPLDQRLRNVKARLEKLPAILDAGRANLLTPPKVYTETAIIQNEGAITLVRDRVDELLNEAPELRDELKPAQDLAIDALEKHGKWLKEQLLPRSGGDFRLGADKFRRKLALTLDSDFTMEQILERAESALAETQEEMYKTALPLYRDIRPTASDEEITDKKKVIRAVLDHLADDHPTAESIVDDAREMLQAATNFVKDQGLVSLPAEPVEIIVMPEFRRGVSVAYCDSPGALESNGKTFFAISPAPSNWTKERTASLYREYNNYMLHDLTVHEAMPGHYLQIAHANSFHAPTMVRSIFPSGPFVEGWGSTPSSWWWSTAIEDRKSRCSS